MKEKLVIKIGRIFLLFVLLTGLLTACADSKEEIKDKEEEAAPTESSEDKAEEEENYADWESFDDWENYADWEPVGISSICQLPEEGQTYAYEYPYGEEIIVYETKADISHDGIADLIRVSGDTGDKEISDVTDCGSGGGFVVKLYRGLQDGSFEARPRFVSDGIFTFHAGNGTICLYHKEGQDYLLVSNTYHMQGHGSYNFTAFYVDDEEGIVVDDQYGIEFETDEEKGTYWSFPHSEEAIPAFKEKISPYIEDAIILVSAHVSTEPEVFYSTSEQEYAATGFFNQMWE